MLKELSDIQAPAKKIYKIVFLWSSWTTQVETRVVRDAFGIQRLARVSGVDYVIACDEIAHKILTNVGIKVTLDMVDPAGAVVYLSSNEYMPADLEDRIPDCDYIETIVIDTPNAIPQVDADPATQVEPYAGVKLFVDWQKIPETLSLEKAPPKGPADPMYSPWL